MKKIAKGKPGKNRLPPKEEKPLVMKKVSLFLRPQTIPKAHAKADKLGLSLTAYVAGLVEADLKKKAA
jgi:hypothetical protein